MPHPDNECDCTECQQRHLIETQSELIKRILAKNRAMRRALENAGIAIPGEADGAKRNAANVAGDCGGKRCLCDEGAQGDEDCSGGRLGKEGASTFGMDSYGNWEGGGK